MGKRKTKILVVGLLLFAVAGCLPGNAVPQPQIDLASPTAQSPIKATVTPLPPALPTDVAETPTAIATLAGQTAETTRKETPIVLTAELPQPEIIEMTPEPTIPAPADPAIQRWIDQAKEDLASRLDVPIDQIHLVTFESVIWPDGGLGCPRPGMVYAQVQVEGFLIRLAAGNRVYAYHGGGAQEPFLCEQTSALPKNPGDDPGSIEPPPDYADD